MILPAVPLSLLLVLVILPLYLPVETLLSPARLANCLDRQRERTVAAKATALKERRAATGA